MYTWTTILLIAAMAVWFLYGLSRMVREAVGKDCASCGLGNSFDYRKPVKVYRSASGHMILTDEEAARKRREKIRALMEGRKA